MCKQDSTTAVVQQPHHLSVRTQFSVYLHTDYITKLTAVPTVTLLVMDGHLMTKYSLTSEGTKAYIENIIHWSTHKMYQYPKLLISFQFNVLKPNMALEFNSWL